MESLIGTFLIKYDVFLLAGALGSIAYRAKNKLPIKDFIGYVITGSFIGTMVGLLFKGLFDWGTELVFAISALSVFFSGSLINETKDVISKISDYISNKLTGGNIDDYDYDPKYDEEALPPLDIDAELDNIENLDDLPPLKD